MRCHELPRPHQNRQLPHPELIIKGKVWSLLGPQAKMAGTVLQCCRSSRQYSCRQQQQTRLTKQLLMGLFNRTQQLRDNTNQVHGRHLGTFCPHLRSRQLTLLHRMCGRTMQLRLSVLQQAVQGQPSSRVRRRLASLQMVKVPCSSR